VQKDNKADTCVIRTHAPEGNAWMLCSGQ
jgi:hypothetical protein